jgi:tryptophan synthase alpha chain
MSALLKNRKQPVSPIAQAMQRAKKAKRPAFIPYITAGDPHLDATPQLIAALEGAGADIIELGVPFSDPMADGPVNQRAAFRALQAGTTLRGILDMLEAQLEQIHVPIVLFTYYNPIVAMGIETFAARAAAAGVRGVLCVDAPPEEIEGDLIPALRQHGIDPIFLLAPTSSAARIKHVAKLASGFVYYVSRLGITGEQAELAPELIGEVKRLRRRVGLPVAVGFGISTAEQVRAVGKAADGVVVGSALVRVVEEGVANGLDASAIAEQLGKRALELLVSR